MLSRILCSVLIVACAQISALKAQTRVFPSDRAQAEAHIAVNPTDPKNLVATAITSRYPTPFWIEYYYSFDGGENWSGAQNISGGINAGDPVVAFDSDGNAYLLYQIITASGLYLHWSSDGGQNWSERLVVRESTPYSLDRPWMAVSPVRNSDGYFDIYVSYTIFEDQPPGSAIGLLRSTNRGESFIPAGSSGALNDHSQGSSVSVGPDGDIFLCWAELDLQEKAVRKIHSKRSTDGGSTYSDLVSVTAFQIGTRSVEENNYYLKDQRVRADSYPRIVVDTSPSTTRGNAYVVWSGKQGANGNPDILMMRWRNVGSGFAWSGVEVIQSGSPDQWMPAVSVSENGVFSVLYYSSSSSPDAPIFTRLRHSTNGGSGFSGEINVGTSAGFVINQTMAKTFLGDYHGLASSLGKAFAVWSEHRNHGSHDPVQAYFREVTTSLELPSGHQIVEVSQVDEGGLPFEKVGRWNQGAFTNYRAPHQFMFQTSTQEVLRAKQQFKSGITEKYNNWETFADVLNHRSVPISPSQADLRAGFLPAYNLTIRTELIDGGSGDGQMQVHFRDPWLIDTTDNYGPRNRGQTEAKWYPHTSPFVPGTGTNYMGLFLGQTVASGRYYTVRAPLTHPNLNNFTWHFIDWKTTGTTQVTQPLSAESPSGVYFARFTATDGSGNVRLNKVIKLLLTK